MSRSFLSLYRDSCFQEVEPLLADYVEEHPRSSSYYYVLAGVYRRLGKAEESRKARDSFTRPDQESNDLEKMRRDISRSNRAQHPGGERE